MFSYPLISGDSSHVLAEPGNGHALRTDRTKYFGEKTRWEDTRCEWVDQWQLPRRWRL